LSDSMGGSIEVCSASRTRGSSLARLSDCAGVLGRINPKPLLRSGAARSPTAPARRVDTPCARRRGGPPSQSGEGVEEFMLRIYAIVIDVLRALRPVVAQIEMHDRDLARQLRRSASSIALNLSEGSGSRGGTRRERYQNALGSAREVSACLDVAEALGYVESFDAALRDRLDHVRATLVKIVR
jgi:four helix bundle protein